MVLRVIKLMDVQTWVQTIGAESDQIGSQTAAAVEKQTSERCTEGGEGFESHCH